MRSGDEFWIVTTGEGTFGVSPVMLRLAQRGTRSAISARYFFVAVSGGIL